MKEHFAELYQSAKLKVDADAFERRWQAVEHAANDFSITTASSFLSSAFDPKAGGAPTQLVDSIRNADPTFTANRTHEVAVLAAATLREIIEESADTIADVVAMLVIVRHMNGLCGISVSPQLVEVAEQHLVDRSTTLRTTDTFSVKSGVIPKETYAAVIQAFQDSAVPTAAAPFEKIVLAQNQALRSHTAAINSLLTRYELLREESNMLWWLTGRHSQIMNLPYAELAPATSTLVIARELAGITKVTPGPVAISAFSRRMLQECHGDNGAQAVQIAAAVNGVPRNQKVLWTSETASHPLIGNCPLTSAVAHSVAVSKESEWPPLSKASHKLDVKKKLAPDLIVRQMYLECLILRTEISLNGR